MYTLKKSYSIITSSPYQSIGQFLHDGPRVPTVKNILKEYLSDARRVFLERFDSLNNFESSFDERNEKHLRIMLDLMIEARKAWDQEAN
jgi:hypothetical protein